jgi:hypothetical protein
MQREEPGGAGTLPASGSGVGDPAQALELAAETFAGPALPADAHQPGLGSRPVLRVNRRDRCRGPVSAR